MSGTKEKLIGTAFQLFGRNGFHNVGLDRIIEETGVSKQTFYNHFESKDQLILEVLDHRHRTEMATLDAQLTRLAGSDPRAKLYAIFDALEEWMSDPEWRGCMFMNATAEFPTKHDPAHQAAARHTLKIQETIQYLATLAGAQNPRLLAEQVTILIDGMIAYVHATGTLQSIATARDLARCLLDDALPAPAMAHPAMAQHV